jgi:hypothetical protein
MKLDEAIRRTFRLPPAKGDGIHDHGRPPLRELVDFMRFRMGYTAEVCKRLAMKVGVAGEVWDKAMLDLDNNDDPD